MTLLHTQGIFICKPQARKYNIAAEPAVEIYTYFVAVGSQNKFAEEIFAHIRIKKSIGKLIEFLKNIGLHSYKFCIIHDLLHVKFLRI